MISVIIPTYNRRELLLRAVQSVLDQTHADLECIVVDDGSTDGTEAALRSLADPRLQYVRQENAGACAARNRGISLAKGEVIAFQDSDDVWHAGKLERQLALLREHAADVVVCAMNREGRTVPENLPDGWLTLDALLRESLCSTQCILGRAEVFHEVGFDPDMPRLQDWDMMLRVAKTRRIWCTREPLVDVYTQPDSISVQPKKRHTALLRLYLKWEETLRQPENAALALHWLRMMQDATPVGEPAWDTAFTAHLPDFCARAGAVPAKLPIHLDIHAFEPGEGRLFLSEALLPEALRKGGFFPDTPNPLAALTAWKGRRYAWDLLCAARGGADAAINLAEGFLTDMPGWARALRGIELPEKTDPVRKIGVYYHTLAGGGVQRVTAALAGLWAEMGYDVTLITTAQLPGEFALPSSVRRVLIPALDPAKPDVNGAHVQGLTEAAKGLDALVYHAWADPLVLCDLLAVRATGCRFLVHTHSVFTLPLLTPGLRDRFAALPDVYALASGVVTLTEADAAYWRQSCARVHVTVNPLPFTPAEVSAAPLAGRTVLWAGRFSAEKRPQDALAVMAEVIRRVPDAKLLLLGAGDAANEAALRRQIDANGLAGHVEMPGFQADMRPWYARADVCLCTSAYEGFCLTLAEAMTCGVPCVAYEMPYLPVLQGGGHLSVPQGDVRAAAEAIVKLLSDGPLRRATGAAGRAHVAGRLLIDQRAKWQAIFDDLATPTPAPPVPDLMLATLRAHAVQHTPEDPAAARPTVFVPMPERGPCKKLRKKAATCLQVLLIDGISGLRHVWKEKQHD